MTRREIADLRAQLIAKLNDITEATDEATEMGRRLVAAERERDGQAVILQMLNR